VHLPHHPFAGFQLAQIDQRGRPALATHILAQSPSAQMMRAGDDAGADALGHPGLVDEVANFGVDLEQVAGRDAEAGGILRMKPQRIAMRYFV
jgi:hypothetical protein